MLPILLLVTVVTLGTAAGPREPEYPHVRSTEPRIARLIDEAARRSQTFARLYTRLQETDVILFVEPARDLKTSLSGRLIFLEATPVARYLRADVRADLPRTDLIATIAHEMQHALEIGDAALVRDESGMALFYRAIGHHDHDDVFDTEVARNIARQVRRELLA
jgi:hypothetical protein